MLQCDCDGFSVFILKEVGSNDSSGPNSAPYGNFWGHKWGVDEVREDLQLTSIESSAY